MAWLFLLVAGLLEVVWAYTMKQSDGFTKPAASIITVVAMVASFGLLSIAMKALPLGTAYAVWTGIGALGALLVGILLLGEETSLLRLASAAVILVGIAGLKLTSPN
jgi:quaternary ammonium compound-resistance protein SugE